MSTRRGLGAEGTATSTSCLGLRIGNFESYADACEFVRVIEKRQSQKVGCIEEVAYLMGFIDKTQLLVLADKYAKSGYGEYLRQLKK